MTSVPQITLTDQGWIAPTESEILDGVLADMNTAFGGGMNTSLDTPQGQMAVTTTAIIGSKNDELLALFNGFDPQFASGRQQDALGRIYFLERDPARATTATVTVTGLSGTVIPAGSLARATDGNLYVAESATTIPVGGTTTATFQCTVTGPIACPADSLNRIYQAVPGWDTINNAADGTIGNDTESRTAFEARRAASVALNAVGILDAIQASVLAVPNVLDAYTTENSTAQTQTIGGYDLAPNSLYVAVSGGTSAAVAQAIWQKKSPGCSYNGNTTVTVQDTGSGYSVPYPTYQVSFVRPDPLPIKFAVVLQNSSGVPSNYVALVRAAIISAFAGGDGGQRARIGSTIYSLRFYSPILALGSWAQVVSIQIGTVTANADFTEVNIDQIPTLASGDIAVSLV